MTAVYVRAYTREIKGASNKDISTSMRDLSKDIERSFEDFSLSHLNNAKADLKINENHPRKIGYG